MRIGGIIVSVIVYVVDCCMHWWKYLHVDVSVSVLMKVFAPLLAALDDSHSHFHSAYSPFYFVYSFILYATHMDNRTGQGRAGNEMT